jgi:hypothetical protein
MWPYVAANGLMATGNPCLVTEVGVCPRDVCTAYTEPVELTIEPRIDRTNVERVALTLLRSVDSPRLRGIDLDHVRTLAESDEPFPPIVVHRPTMRVIDGIHRVHATILRGGQDIAACYFSGGEPDAFVLAVDLNSKHGLPLTRADRVAAAARIIRTHPRWSDRTIAQTTLLGHQTIGEIRRRATGGLDQSHTRVGRDGRVRPVNSASARRLAGTLIMHSPHASLRQIARVTGLSPGTVRDVRERLGRGEDPVPPRLHQLTHSSARSAPRARERVPVTGRAAADVDAPALLHALHRDPALRLTESGRLLLRLLGSYLTLHRHVDALVLRLPAHCTDRVAALARACAAAWQRLADRLDGDPPDSAGDAG